MIRCALLASAGSLEKLRVAIDHLKIDYRDVIMAGECISKDGEPTRVRNPIETIEDEA